MKKRIIALSLTAALAAVSMGITAAADDEPITVTVNDVEVEFTDIAPFIENEHTLVPMRAIFEALGAVVNWDGETRTVVSYDPVSDVSIILQIDSATMFVGETPVELETPARIVNDRTVVPVRAIAEGMNSVVDWNGETRTVIVTKDVAKDSGEDGTQDPEAENAQIPNPWTEYATLDELNAAINELGAIKYSVAVPDDVLLEVKENGYRYLAESNLAEIQAIWSVGAGADVVIRTEPADADISGISGGKKVEEYNLEDGTLVEIYKYANTVYAVWSSEDAAVYSFSVSVTAEDWDPTEVVKTLVGEVIAAHPVG